MLKNKLIFSVYVFLVLGQIPGFLFDRLYNFPFTIQPLDVAVALAFPIAVSRLKKKVPNWYYWFLNFACVSFFSLIISLNFLPFADVLIGALYLVRLIFYISFTLVFEPKEKKLYYNSLILVGIGIAILGWIQYFLVPDLRTLKIFGWDDHHFRLVSTYLDPAFTGILITMSTLLVLAKTMQEITKLRVLLILFLILTLAFTYSRSSFLSLFAGTAILIILYKNRLLGALVIIFLVIALPFLPRPSSEGVKLERLNSVFSKVENYKEGFYLFSRSPLLGVGYNNICAVKGGNGSNSCYGLDNSFLLILVTTGFLGFVAYLKFLYELVMSTKTDLYGKAFLAIGTAVLVHSMFTNTLFYIGVLAFSAPLIAMSRRD